MAKQARHPESVKVLKEEARRYGGGIHGDFVNEQDVTEIDIEFPDVVVAGQFASTVRAVFSVHVDLRDPVSSLWVSVVLTVKVTDSVHQGIVRHPS